MEAKQLIEWLEKRISTTEQEIGEADELFEKVSKGGKITAYKGMLDYVKTHKEDESKN